MNPDEAERIENAIANAATEISNALMTVAYALSDITARLPEPAYAAGPSGDGDAGDE